MAWYRVKMHFQLNGQRYSPGDALFLDPQKAKELSPYLVPEQQQTSEPSSAMGKVVKIKKLAPWWKRLFY